MPDDSTPDPEVASQPISDTTVSGSVNLAGDQVTIGGGVVGRDMIDIHAEGATIIVGAAPDKVREGLAVLHELMQHSVDVRKAVVAFQTDFEAAHQQLDSAGDCKDLHDLLHKLQFFCYDPLVQEAARFPHDDLAIDNLTDCLLTLEGIVNELQQVAARPSLSKREPTWISEVRTAKVDLACALDKLDPQLLRRVIIRLKRLLSTQPSRINVMLNQAARHLRLRTLAEAMAQVSGNVAALNLNPDKVGQFQAGVIALNDLERNLDALVDDHDCWQEIEVELWRIEGSLTQSMDELEVTWSDLKTRSDELCSTCEIEWAAALRQDAAALTTALAENSPLKIKRAFRSYRRRASNRFYQVDGDLKSICGELRKIGLPLASVLRMME